MVVDKLENIHKYSWIPIELQEKVTLLTSPTRELSENSEIEVGDSKIIIESTLTRANQTIESHQIMSDLHISLKGEEYIEYYHIEDVRTIESYNLEKDYTLYRAINPPISRILLKKGMFVYFGPRELHIPGIWTKGYSENILKMVVKFQENPI